MRRVILDVLSWDGERRLVCEQIAPDEYSARLRLKWDDSIWARDSVRLLLNERTTKRRTKWGRLKMWHAPV